ncbi:Monacolin J acid methylbutanoyltransferase [Hyphodiscus hymeniophilus]|uniref:Monacolin J acid methylbutanoyltransferase n=1 Tax=Hyphodiscus hymeniophilus TaxID=353542 RepID=A0A9P6SQ62_9HELO|nr:Monacolin J acid methylbutanoyltransferase [Hyphodiscus hymeniophilus]
MEAFEGKINSAIKDVVVANAVVEARSKDPSYRYSKAFGHLDLSPNSPSISSDAVYWIASCTKLLTSVCALQCVQRNLITLDEPVSRILPEFAHPDIITGFDASTKKLILVKAKNPITLRHLLTHTSGMTYAHSDPLVAEWRAQNPIGESTRDVVKEYVMPLIFEPGEPGKWKYSVGIDWAGMIVERLNGGVKLGDYMEEHIFKPLGMKNMTFRLLQRKDLMDKMCPRVARRADGKLEMDEMVLYPVIEPVDDSGGGGLYATAGDYVKVLESLLRDDGKLLGSSTLELLFKPQLPDSEELQKTLNKSGPGNVMNGFGENEVNLSHALGGLVAVDGVSGSVGKGMLCWDGLPNCFWWIDREKGTCGFYGSQMLPSGDRKTGELFGEFRKAASNSV